jgi:hypothetical protein
LGRTDASNGIAFINQGVRLTQGPSTLSERIRYGLLTFVVSVTCGYGFFYGYYVSRVNRGFEGKTDIIGYPTFANFNNKALFDGCLLGLLTAIVASLVVLRFVNLRQLEGFLARLAPVALASLIIAFALVLKSNGTWYGWATSALVALALFKAGAYGFDRQRKQCGKFATAEGVFSIIVAATIPLLLFYVSQNTGWRSVTGIIVHARWFPVPVLIAAEFLIVALGGMCLTKPNRADLFDKHIIRLMLIPALIYLLTAVLPGTRLLGDEFHSGEKLAPLSLGLRGALPWRDFLFVHGVWDDFLQLYIPARLWEPTLRAGVAGTPLLFGPIYWICFYLLFLVLFDFSLFPAVIAFFILISSNFGFPDPFRFLLYPVTLLCLYYALRYRRTILYILLIALCGIQVLLAPEFGLLAFSFGCIIMIRDLLDRDGQQTLAQQFRPTLVCGVSTALFITLALWLLSSWGFLDGFLVTIIQFARGHFETGNIPVQSMDFMLWLTGLPLLFVVASTLVIAQAFLRSRKEVPAAFWLVWGIALCTALYYPKYIGRADSHIIQVFAVASPGLALLPALLLEQIRRSHYRPWILTAAGSLGLGLLLMYGVPGIPSPNWFHYALDGANSFRSRFIAMDQDKNFPAVTTTPAAAAKTTALRQFFDTHLRIGESIFDFSDSPTLFFALLQLKPASRFIHVSMAIQEEAQREVLKDLEKSRPPYVIYQSDGGLNGWDGIPNEVRHFVIARYINLHYAYDRTIDGSIIFRRADLPDQGLSDPGPETLSTCPLGHVPNFFSPRAQLSGGENALATDPAITKYLQLAGWAAFPADHSPPEVVVSYKGTVLDRFEPSRSRPDVDKVLGRSLGPTGFNRRITLPDQKISVKDIEISGKNATTRKLFHFEEGPLRGWVDSSILMQAVSLLPPRSERPAYLALQFTDTATREPQEFSITPSQPNEARVTFTRIAGKNELLLPLGGCYAWGAISKSIPQIASSKPFTLKSASYYYE